MKNKILEEEGQLNFPLDYAGIRKTLILLRSVNHKIRQRIIEIIGRGKKIVVTDICNELNLDQSGVVQTERQGKFIFYFLNVEKLYHIQSLVQLETIQNERLMAAFEPQGRKRQFFWQ